MKKIILTLAVIVLFVGALYLAGGKQELASRFTNDAEDLTVGLTDQNNALAAGTYIVYHLESVLDRGSNIDSNIDDIMSEEFWAYQIESKETIGPLTEDDLGRLELLNKRGIIQSKDGSVVVEISYGDPSSDAGGLDMNVRLSNGEENTVDLFAPDLKLNLDFPYPVSVDDDNSSIYLVGQREVDGFASGLWRYDVASKKITRCDYCDKFAVKMIYVNPTTKQAIGTTFPEPEGLSDPFVGPSGLHLIDLETLNATEIASSADNAILLPSLSPEGTYYSFNYVNDDPLPLWIVPLKDGDSNIFF